jgi:hypothetical protein
MKSFLEDNSGGYSATRLAFLLWAVGVLAVWVYTSIKNGSIQPLDGSVTTILGILMTGKVVQRFGEKPEGSDEESGKQKDKASGAVQNILHA